MTTFRSWLVLMVCLMAAPAFAQTSSLQPGDLGALNACLVLPVQGMGTASVEVVGTWSGTLTFTVSNTGDAAGYGAVNLFPPNSSTAITTTTANGRWAGSVAGYRFFRACMTSYSSGRASLLMSAAATGGGGAGAVTVDLSGSSVSGNAAASNTGSSVPAAADYLGINVGGTLTGVTAGQATMANSIPVALASNQSQLATNVAQINGVTPLMGTGNTGTGSPRVTIATDQVAIPVTVATVPSHAVTNAGTFNVQVTSMPADATELPAASALTDAMANPTTPLIGAALMSYNGATWDRLQPALDYAQNSTTASQTGGLIQGATTVAAPSYTTAKTNPISLDLAGNLRVVGPKPCDAIAHTTLAISVADDTRVITASASNRNYICGGLLVAATAEIVNIWEGTGTVCATGSAAVAGSTTEAQGMSLAANGGFIIAQPIRGISTNVDTCIRLSGTNRVSGWIEYVQAP